MSTRFWHLLSMLRESELDSSIFLGTEWSYLIPLLDSATELIRSQDRVILDCEVPRSAAVWVAAGIGTVVYETVDTYRSHGRSGGLAVPLATIVFRHGAAAAEEILEFGSLAKERLK
jgi:hypothetical protein